MESLLIGKKLGFQFMNMNERHCVDLVTIHSVHRTFTFNHREVIFVKISRGKNKELGGNMALPASQSVGCYAAESKTRSKK